MTVYHGSNVIVSEPDLLHTRNNVDFGPGFYITTIQEQAEKWAERFKDAGKTAFLNRYRLDEKIMEQLEVLQFDSYSDAWLDFIVSCRKGLDCTRYDIVIGGVANDKVFNIVQLYFKGYIEKDTALQRLKYEKPNVQICLRILDAIQCLTYEGSELL